MSQRTNPFEEIERLFDRMSRQFEEAQQSWETESPLSRWSKAFEEMSIDVVEHDDEFVVTVDLPGFERDDVDITVTNHTLRINAQREADTTEEGERFLRRERRHESASRSIELPGDVDVEAVTATMQNGVLTITLPKIEGESAQRIEIE